MSAPAAESYDLKKGQLFNLLLITFASTVGFWAWTIVGPLAKYYAKPEQMNLNPGTTSLLVAMPIFIGAVGRIPIGGLTDKYGGRIMMSLVLAVSTPLVLLVGLAGSMKSFPLMLVFSFLLGIAGTVFAVGIPFSSAWYPPARKGFATGVFGAGMVGTALSAFFTPRLLSLVGYMNTHYMIAGLCAVTAVVSFLFLRDSPATANREVTPLMPKIIRAFKVKSTWQLCFLYSVVFGGFVAFSNYLPTYLNNIYNFDPEAAGARAAGFAAAAVVARPFGGILADKFGPKIITFIALGGVSALALVTAFQPDAEHVYGPIFLAMAALLGLGSGSVFGWVGRAADPKNMGAVSGVIAATGALGGFFPPLVMGATYDAAHRNYFVGLTLLAVTAAVAFASAFFVKHGGKPEHHKALVVPKMSLFFPQNFLSPGCGRSPPGWGTTRAFFCGFQIVKQQIDGATVTITHKFRIKYAYIQCGF